jgi:glycosyltransferase involved in cell wall biosynthesis
VNELQIQGSRLRIAVLNRLFTPTAGGAERYSIALVEQLAAQHDIHVFAQEIDHHFQNVNYHPVFFPFKRPRWINQLWFATATWWLTRKGFDVVHSHENTWHGNVQTVHVLPVHYTLFIDRKGMKLIWQWLRVITSLRLLTYLGLEKLRYAAKKGRCIVLPSSSLQPIMLNVFPHTQDALHVVTPGVVKVAGLASHSQKLANRKALGLPSNGSCVLLVGNDFRKKGLPALLHALHLLPSEFYVAVVGNAAQIGGVQSDIDRYGVKDRVHFIGSMQDVSVAYMAADCLAHPTLEDTFAMVVLEAMSFGLPVVVSSAAYCGISAQLTADENAVLLDQPLDGVDLAKKLEQVLADEALRMRLSEGAIAFASHYLWSKQAQKTEAIYYSVMQQRN